MCAWWGHSQKRWGQQWWSDDQKWPAQGRWQQQALWDWQQGRWLTERSSTRQSSVSSSSSMTTTTKQSATKEDAELIRKRHCLDMEWERNRLKGLLVTNFKTSSTGHNGMVWCDWFLQTLTWYLFRDASSGQQVPAPFSLSVWRFSGPLARHPGAGRIYLGFEC